MDRDARTYLAVIIIVGTLYILSSALKVAALEDLFLLSAVLGGLGVAGKIVKDKKLNEKLSQIGGNSSGSNYSIDQCRDIAKEWAKKNYSGKIKSKKGVSFDWTQASTDIATVYDFSSEEYITVRYFYTQYGPKNKGTIIFVDASNGEVLSHQPVKQKNIKDEPFEYLEMFRMTNKHRGRIPRTDKEEQNTALALQGIPVQNQGNPQTDKEN